VGPVEASRTALDEPLGESSFFGLRLLDGPQQSDTYQREVIQHSLIDQVTDSRRSGG
jgi:hypothetical protein